MNGLLQAETRYASLFSLLSSEEQSQMMNTLLVYGASVNDTDIFTGDISTQ